MNLLPKSREEFSQKEYWDSFFKKRGTKAFEWYGEYPELSDILHKYIKQQDDILIAGCGNSTLGRDLYDIGYSKITNIDISQVVIRQMLSQNEKDRPGLKYLQMDVLETSFSNEEFSVVLDKGTLDALMPDDEVETVNRIKKYFTEIQRILKFGGRYVCISLLQEHILNIILEYFPSNNWMFRVVRCFEAETKAADNGENPMPVFVTICTKFKALPQKILEVNLTSNDKMQRFGTVDEVMEQVKSAQQAAFICSGLKRTSIDSEVTLDLHRPGDSKPRFTVYVVDSKSSKRNAQYAAFIVPQGRETEWLFSTSKGRCQLLKMTKTDRLAIVTLHRGQDFGDFDQVQLELADAIRNLAPSDFKNKKIPFLSLGSDVGKRTVRFEGRSRTSGDYVVEDVEIDDRFRRLFYSSSQLVIQSEAKLKTIRTKKGRKEVVDLTHLTCKHHVYMSVAVHMACGGPSKKATVAVVGLGGGGLCSFLRKFLPEVKISAVDHDEDMVKVATKWFGLNLDEKLTVTIKDGLEYLEEAAGEREKLDAILFDVDSKDSTIGMSCPPKEFLEESVLDNVVNAMSSKGLFILNLVLRDENLRPSILNSLSKKFKTVVCYKLEEDLNEILICCCEKLEADCVKKHLRNGAYDINLFFKRSRSNCDDNVAIESYLSKINIL